MNDEYNKEVLEFYFRKYLNYLSPEQLKEIEVTDAGFVYKGNLLVAINNLKELLKVKVEVTETLIDNTKDSLNNEVLKTVVVEEIKPQSSPNAVKRGRKKKVN